MEVCPEWKTSFLKFLEDMGPRPEDCDGIELIDLDGDFCKANCRWVGPHNRRSCSEMPGNTKRLQEKVYKSPTMVCIRIEKNYHEFLKRLAAEKSDKTGKIYSVSRMIGEMLEQEASMPNQANPDDQYLKKLLAGIPIKKKKEGKSAFKKPIMVGIRAEKAYHDFFKCLAIERSNQTGEIYSVSQLIREIIEKHAPIPTPKQLDMFSAENS